MKQCLIIFYLIFVLKPTKVNAANLPALKALFIETYDSHYIHGMCGKNVYEFVAEAKRQKINLEKTYVAKIIGSGFLETSGFYTRFEKNKRSMLGYFHMVFIADGHVFDFDLALQDALPLHEYVRLQFTPPYQPYRIFGVLFDPVLDFPWWEVTRYELDDYLDGIEKPTWKMKMSEFVNIEKVMAIKRKHED